jgi:hypothetical protein
MIALLLFAFGCASTLSPEIRQAAQRYQTVNRWMNRDEVYRILGQPQNRLADGREQWRVSDRGESAELLLRFEQRYPMAGD